MRGRARADRGPQASAATPVVLASSAKEDEVDHYLDLLDARELADAWTDVGRRGGHQARSPTSCTPRCEQGAAGGEAVMVGDTPWDVKAAGARRRRRRSPC